MQERVVRTRAELGQVLPLVLLVIITAGGLVLVLGRLGGDAVDRARAQSAADAAALAGAAAGRSEAEAVATANGARVVTWEEAGADVRVRVSYRGFVASARARHSNRSQPARFDATEDQSGLSCRGARHGGQYAPCP